MFNSVLDFFNRTIDFLHLPLITPSDVFGQVGYYTEIVAIVLIFLLIVNIILKIIIGDEFFSWSTITLFILIFVCLIIIAIIWYIPNRIDNSWPRVQPHL